jgi:hypothetical protein
MNAFVGFQGQVQEKELDSCPKSASGGWQWDEGAGRNPSGFSLREFLRSKREGWRSAALCVPRFPFFSVQPITSARLNREGPVDAAQNPGCRPGGVLSAGAEARLNLAEKRYDAARQMADKARPFFVEPTFDVYEKKLSIEL